MRTGKRPWTRTGMFQRIRCLLNGCLWSPGDVNVRNTAHPWPLSLLLLGEDHVPQPPATVLAEVLSSNQTVARAGPAGPPRMGTLPGSRASHRTAKGVSKPRTCLRSPGAFTFTRTASRLALSPPRMPRPGWPSPEHEREPIGHSPRETRVSCFGVCKNEHHPRTILVDGGR